jgi:ATP/maltotriose-dependent transcriptional regulator MalT
MKAIADSLGTIDAAQVASQPAAQAQVEHFRSAYSMVAGDMMSGIRHLEAAIGAFEQARDVRNALMERNTLACNYVEAGHFVEAVRIGRQNLQESERAKVPGAHTLTLVILGYALTFDPATQEEAQDRLAEALRRSRDTGHRMHEGWALSALARLLFITGRYSKAEEQARLAAELTGKESPSFQAGPLAWLARAMGRQGRPAEGLLVADQAVAVVKNTAGFCFGPMVPILARAELLLQLAPQGGDVEAARQAVAAAKRRILRLADRFVEPRWRTLHLAHPENRETLQLPEPPAATADLAT